MLVAAREMVDEARDVVVVAVRARDGADVALRAIAARDAVVVAARDVVGRPDTVTDCERGDVFCFVVVREITLPDVVRETVCVARARETVDASRTAASATLMPTQHTITKGKIFLILTTITMLAKKIDFEQGLFNKKTNKKSHHTMGLFID